VRKWFELGRWVAIQEEKRRRAEEWKGSGDNAERGDGHILGRLLAGKEGGRRGATRGVNRERDGSKAKGATTRR
jgi:hypothetical protein